MSTDVFSVAEHCRAKPDVATELRLTSNDEFDAVILVTIDRTGVFADGTDNGAN